MKFICSSNSSDAFELAILGYGKTTKTWRDRNRVQCRFSTFRGQNQDAQSAPLPIWEVKRLLNGLRSLWSRAANRVTLNFSEPGLSMEVRALPNDQYCLQIQLDHGLTPSWHKYPDFPVEMDILLNRNQLNEAIEDLSDQMANYPER